MERTRDEKLEILLEQLKALKADSLQEAEYLHARGEKDRIHKAWLEGRASGFARAAEWLGRVLA